MSAKRPASGGVVPASKRARKTINFEVKMDVLERFEVGQRAVDIGRALGLPATTVRTIRSNADKIRECVQSVTPLSAVRMTKGRDKVMNHMERLLSAWIEAQGRRKVHVSWTRIQEKAKSLFHELKREHTQSSRMETFSASRGWFQRFTRRCHLRDVTGIADAVVSEDDAGEEEPRHPECVAEEGDRSSRGVLNAQQTGLCWTPMSSRGHISKGGKVARKDHVTLPLGHHATGDGNHKTRTSTSIGNLFGHQRPLRFAMNRDLSGEDHRANPPGSTIGSHGGNSLVPGGSLTDRGSRVGPPEDEESGPGFIVKVKVKTEFVDDSFPQHEGGAHLVKTENFQTNFLQTSQDALNNEGVKQEPCDSPSTESSNATQMLTDPSQAQPAQIKAPASASSTRAGSSIADYARRDDVFKAEILWALKVMESHYSFKSCEDMSLLFHKMFSDSSIAAQFKCAARKTAYLNVFGLAPHFQSLLKQKADSKYVLLFDESLNKNNQKKQLNFYIRLWENDEVRSRYLDSKFVGHCTAEDMQAEFHSVLEGLNPRNLVQFSMNGPSVNWKFHKSVQLEMETSYGKSLLDVGSCSLHNVHGAFQTGVQKSGIGIDKLLHALYTLFSDSPARREDYMNVTEGAKVPLKFCKTRWLDNSPCASRAIEIWDSICFYVDMVNKRKITNPGNESFVTVQDFVKSPLTLARLKFFLSVCQQITPFLIKYQSDQPMLPYITNDLKNIIQSVLERYLKSSEESSLTALQLSSFDVSDQNNFAVLSKVDVGLAADKVLKEAIRTKMVSHRGVLEFRMECRTLLVKMVCKLVEKSPIKYPLARSLACLDPRHFQKKDVVVKLMRRALTTLVDARWITAEIGDEALRQYTRYLDDAFFRHTNFDPRKDRLDHLWHSDLAQKQEFDKLWSVVKQLLLLSHGQATVERGVSVNEEEVEVENLKEETTVAQRIICDHLNAVGGVQNVQLDDKLLISAAGAYKKYQLYLEEQKHAKEHNPVMTRKKKLKEETATLKSHQKRLKTDIDAMTKSADELALKAEKDSDLTCISKSNSLRRSAKDKEEELKELQKQLDEKTFQLMNV